jgi:dGTPase
VTQVVGVSHGQVFHNRLTHTIKVAQVGRRLAEWVSMSRARGTSKPLPLHPEVVEAACLAHDLGHPPFGHIAEHELDECARRAGESGNDGYEGNAQTFRILTVLATHRENQRGLNLTRATLNACLKYPWLRQAEGEKSKKFGAYQSEREQFKFARGGSRGDEQSLEAQLMDWADDIAYSVHDIEDFFRAGLVPLDRLALDVEERRRCAAEVKGLPPERALDFITKITEFVPQALHRPYDGTHSQRGALRWYTSFLVGRYVKQARIVWSGSRPRLEIAQPIREENFVLKTLMRHYVFSTSALAAQQHGQRKVIRELYGIFLEAASGKAKRDILPPFYRELASDDACGATPTRLAADAVASMTEAQAGSLHARLCGRAPGLVVDPILR